MRNNEELTGGLEYHDAHFIRLTRKQEPNLFIYKHEVKYLRERPSHSFGHPMDNLDYLSVAVDIAREAGSLLLQHYEQRIAIEYKGEFNLVTAADRAAETLIVERLRNRFPTHSIVADESESEKNMNRIIVCADAGLGRRGVHC